MPIHKRGSANEVHSRSGARPVHRCAIYTRKSSEEGLEQEFNSLDAQREACEAFVRSQKHAGWVTLAEMYDDGGVSGGTLERPALQRLLADIGAGRVDTVVVYKVDRLTRSLADFAKIVDAFDAKGVAFVSVTQQFNTTTSMGRLTLNMLLSFAQFEREVTGERIRDKIAASKQKGMWMGGYPPLGYDVADRKLVVNEAEAETVRHIFRRYAALKSVRALKEELDATGIVSKMRDGRIRPGGQPIARGALYRMLQNRLYRGEITHKGAAYPGQHEAIVDQELWEQVQSCLGENRVDRDENTGLATPSLLTGLVYDGAGGRMSPSHANKKGRRYRYYVSQSLIKQDRGKAPPEACRVPAADLEAIVEGRICALLRDASAVYEFTRALPDAQSRKALLAAAAALGETWPSRPASERRDMLHRLVGRITVRADRVEIEVRLGALSELTDPSLVPDCATIGLPPTVLTVPARLKRTGLDTKLLVDAASGSSREPDRSLLRLLAQAHRFWALANSAQGRDMRALAQEVGVSPSYFARVLRLALLAPAVTQAILQGRQPADLTANRLKLAGTIPSSWSEQQRQFGLI